jgi:hypothetical protein
MAGISSSEDQLLRVREPDLQTLANPDVYQLSGQPSPVVLTEIERQDLWLFGPQPLGSGPTYPGFRSQAFDQEARFRALKLYVAGSIQIGRRTATSRARLPATVYRSALLYGS